MFSYIVLHTMYTQTLLDVCYGQLDTKNRYLQHLSSTIRFSNYIQYTMSISQTNFEFQFKIVLVKYPMYHFFFLINRQKGTQISAQKIIHERGKFRILRRQLVYRQLSRCITFLPISVQRTNFWAGQSQYFGAKIRVPLVLKVQGGYESLFLVFSLLSH